jgi:hypothetical protein
MLYYVSVKGLHPVTLEPHTIVYPYPDLLEALEACKQASLDGYPVSIHIEEMN